MKVVAVVSAKGGVGKTTVAANLATALTLQGIRTLLGVDLDPQNALALHFGAHPQATQGVSRSCLAGEGLAAAVWSSPGGVHVLAYGVVTESDRMAFERYLEQHPQWLADQLQGLGLPPEAVVIIDTPPGPSVYMQQALTAAQGVVVVTLADAASYAALPLMQRLVQAYCAPRADFIEALYVVNQASGGRQLSKDITRIMQDDLKDRLVGVVHEDEAVREALAYDKSVLDYDPSCQATHDFRNVAQRVTSRLRLGFAR